MQLSFALPKSTPHEVLSQVTQNQVHLGQVTAVKMKLRKRLESRDRQHLQAVIASLAPQLYVSDIAKLFQMSAGALSRLRARARSGTLPDFPDDLRELVVDRRGHRRMSPTALRAPARRRKSDAKA